MNQKRIFSLQIALLLLCAFFYSCTYTYTFHIMPVDAEVKVEGEILANPAKYTTRHKTISVTADKEGYEFFQATYNHKDFFKPGIIAITLEKLQYPVTITVTDAPSVYSIDDTLKGITPVTLSLTHGKHSLVLTRDKYAPQVMELDITRSTGFVFRHQPKDPGLKPVGVFKCGKQPKQLNFSPDNRYIYITLLDDYGFQVFDMEQLAITATVTVGTESSKKGFVEGLFIPRYASYLVTQMQTNSIYEYGTGAEHLLKRKISSGGSWPKVTAYSPGLDLLAVSNWISNTVALINYQSGKVVHTITGLATPRGIAFTHDNRYLVVCSFDGGFIKKYSTADWQERGTITKLYAAMRHVVIAQDDKSAWISDMGRSVVYDIDLEAFTVRKTYKVFANTNTIGLSPDERFLFASCRGPNHPESYLLRSPENGQITIIDVKKQEIVSTIYGGNQPTGLAVSSDGKYLCFSNFKDDNFEIYELAGLYP